jgi:precorrin-3B methylase
MRITLRTSSILALVVALGVGTTGCAASSVSTAHPAASSSSSSAADDEIPRHDLSDERAVAWTRFEVVDDHHLRLFFSSGDPECYGARAEVRESETAVIVGVIVGILPDAPGTCTAVARFSSIVVTTDQPIGDRVIQPLG